MRYWDWRIYAAIAAICLAFAGGRVEARGGRIDVLSAVALLGGAFQLGNAVVQYRRPR